MEVLEVTFRIVTPLYLAGADGRKAELRLPSIKGALRFWYRAADGKYKCLHPDGMTYEEKLFGGSSGKAGQSQFLMMTDAPKLKYQNHSRFEGLDYITFFLRKRNGTYFLPEQEFKVQFLMRNDQNDWRSLIASIWLLGHLGGLGYRSRRGFGTVALKSWELKDKDNKVKERGVLEQLPIAHEKKTLEEWKEAFNQGMKKILDKRDWFQSHSKVSHTLLNSKSSFYLFEEKFSSWEKALQRSMECLKEFRQSAKLERMALGLPMIIKGRSFPRSLINQRLASPAWLRVIQIGQNFYPFFAVLSAPPVSKMFNGFNRNQLPPDHSLESFKNHLQESGFVEVSSFR